MGNEPEAVEQDVDSPDRQEGFQDDQDDIDPGEKCVIDPVGVRWA